MKNRFIHSGEGLTVKGITREFIRKQKISIPPLESQKEIVEKINKEKKIIDGNRELIKIYTQKIQDKIKEVWDM